MPIINVFRDTDFYVPVDVIVAADGFSGAYLSFRADKNTPVASITLTNAEALELASQLESLVQRNGGVL
jgi:hypothetical protein